jgi:hypothetical protein
LRVACYAMTDSKLLNSLTVEDLTRQPCWKFFMLDNIEFVLPVEKEGISETDSDNYIVLTEFFLNDKTKHFGFCSPQDTSGLDYIQPVIITSNGHLPLYFDTIKNLDLPELTNKIINKEIDKVFPLTFITRIKCDKEYYEGKLDNFNSLAD